MSDRAAIRALIEDWVIWRDSGDWERLATLWHPESRMVATWCELSGLAFVERSRAAWNAALTVIHTLGGISIDLDCTRAVAQTRMTILQRAPVHGVMVDVTCHGRFWDAVERGEDGRWRLRLRQPIYELDSMAAVGGAPMPALDPSRLAAYPLGYRHLAYLQTEAGMNVNPLLPGTRDEAVRALQVRGRRWMAGGELSELLDCNER